MSPLTAAVKGRGVDLAINARYLVDALAEFGDRVTLEIVSATASVGIRSADGSGPQWFIMPMHSAD